MGIRGKLASTAGQIGLRVAPRAMARWQWREGAGVGPIRDDLCVGRDAAMAILRTLVPVRAEQELIRIGAAGDGGYLVPDDLGGIEVLLSAGVGAAWSFERDLGERFGIRSSMCDGSVEAPSGLTDLQAFTRRNVAARSDTGVVTLAEWVEEAGVDGDLMLQMDIEGAEVEVLAGVDPAVLRRFRIIVLEVHQLPRALLAGPAGDGHRAALARIDDDFVPVHIHPNNCCGTRSVHGVDVPNVLEVTYLRRDRLTEPPVRVPVGHAADAPNVPAYPPVVLPSDWPG